MPSRFTGARVGATAPLTTTRRASWHNDWFRGLHARLDYLAASQAYTLDRLRQELRQPRRAVDVFRALFGRHIDESDGGLLNMATGESLAC